MNVVELPLSHIVPGKNDRTIFPEAHIRDLTASIAAHGVQMPIVVRALSDGRFQLVAGECRTRASRLAHRTTIPAVVTSVSDEEAAGRGAEANGALTLIGLLVNAGRLEIENV